MRRGEWDIGLALYSLAMVTIVILAVFITGQMVYRSHLRKTSCQEICGLVPSQVFVNPDFGFRTCHCWKNDKNVKAQEWIDPVHD